MVIIHQLANLVANAAVIRIEKKHIHGPRGMGDRNSVNSLLC